MTTINTIQVPAAPPSNRVPAELPDCQGRHGTREGSRRTDVDRADPGVLPDAIAACLGRGVWHTRPEYGPLAIQTMAEQLSKIRAAMLDDPESLGTSNLLFALESLSDEIDRIRHEVLPLTNNDLPLVVKGRLLDATA